MKFGILLCFTLSAPLWAANEPERSGHATATWLAGSAKLEAGSTLKTVVRLKVDPEWHVYWVNPGEAGMPTSAVMKLPKGWTSGALVHPVPRRFLTGELHGFGHGGVVDYALELQVPKDFEGAAILTAEISWLTCNNAACVPGNATLALNVVDGQIAADAVDVAAVEKAFSRLPVTAPKGVNVEFKDNGKQWEIVLNGAEALGFDPAASAVFIETPELVAPSAVVKFRKSGDRYIANAPKSEYIPEKVAKCAILLVPEGKKLPVRLIWSGMKSP